MSLTLLLLFGVLVLFGVPLATALGIASAITLALFTDIPLNLVAQSMFSSMNSFLMVAVPLFILAGLLMDEGGLGEKIFDFANAIVGWLPGGLGQVNVVSSMVFAGMSGSSVADIASIGLIEITSMTKNGYPKGYATALTLVTSVLATIIPPSILMVIAGSVANESIGRLLVAGLVPGLLIGGAFMLYNHIYCVRHGYGKRIPFDPRAAAAKTLTALPALLVPAVLMYGIVGGFFTPTEAAGIAVLYTILIALLVYRNVNLRQLPGFFFRTAKLTGTILFIAVTAKMAGWIFAYDALPAKIAALLTRISTSPTVIMLLTVLFLIIVGMFMDATASLFILIPILLPPLQAVGIDPVHFLVVMVITLSLGLVTPPVGVCLFAVSNLTDLSLEQVTRESLGLMAILAAAVLLIALVPQIVLGPLQWIGI
ncbi:TRAP transporter large permease [Caldinitratiruptor microaerophilus]|uniref:ABC transporter permease n=1 Tax=Caldinitratiruptor microaerophilus TaxID=671077 RepID=A0AA35G7Q4_9FIRM|nr:TRAP transporter large permease [Caldinitratiruptor microaerophilus]BDG60155.1 ABC transporter permease [Caldinitratiruptor microaerophilus]